MPFCSCQYLELLLSRFREGWKINLYQVPQVGKSPSSLVPFLVVGRKEGSKKMHTVTANIEDSGLPRIPDKQVFCCGVVHESCESPMHSWIAASGQVTVYLRRNYLFVCQGRPLLEVIDKENKFRKLGSRIFGPDHVSEDIFKALHPGRRLMLTLGGEGLSKFFYKTWVLDAKVESSKPAHGCAVFLVPKVGSIVHMAAPSLSSC